jgi:Flp pilus assembly protein TadG
MRPSTFRNERGVALIEFALVLPLLAVMLFAALDMGKAFNYWIDETQLAHEAARYAAVDQNPDPVNHPGNFLAAVRAQADTPELLNGGHSVTSPLRICVHLPQGPAVGKPVQVTVESDYRFMSIFGRIPGFALQKPVNAQSTMRLERIPSFADGECA